MNRLVLVYLFISQVWGPPLERDIFNNQLYPEQQDVQTVLAAAYVGRYGVDQINIGVRQKLPGRFRDCLALPPFALGRISAQTSEYLRSHPDIPPAALGLRPSLQATDIQEILRRALERFEPDIPAHVGMSSIRPQFLQTGFTLPQAYDPAQDMWRGIGVSVSDYAAVFGQAGEIMIIPTRPSANFLEYMRSTPDTRGFLRFIRYTIQSRAGVAGWLNYELLLTNAGGRFHAEIIPSGYPYVDKQLDLTFKAKAEQQVMTTTAATIMFPSHNSKYGRFTGLIVPIREYAHFQAYLQRGGLDRFDILSEIYTHCLTNNIMDPNLRIMLHDGGKQSQGYLHVQVATDQPVTEAFRQHVLRYYIEGGVRDARSGKENRLAMFLQNERMLQPPYKMTDPWWTDLVRLAQQVHTKILANQIPEAEQLVRNAGSAAAASGGG